MRRFVLALLALLALAGNADAAFVGTQRSLLSAPTIAQPVLDYDFARGLYTYYPAVPSSDPTTVLTVVRASTATNLMPNSASGFAYSTFGTNVARVTLGSGLLIEESRTNRLLNSTVPATRTTASLATGTYTLWVNGSGSATMSAGTGTGCGTGVATQGTSVNFTLTGAGTCTVTVSGSLNTFQLELGSFGTSFIVTAGSVVTRAADAISSTSIVGINRSTGTFVATGAQPIDTGAPARFFYEFNDDSFVNRIYGLTSAASLQTKIFSGSVQTSGFQQGASSNPVGSIQTVGISYSPGIAFGAVLPNVPLRNIAVLAAAPPAAATTLFIGRHGTSSASQLNGYLRRLRYWPYFVSQRTLNRIVP